MVFVVGVVVDRDLAVALRRKHLLDNVEALLQVALAIRGRVIGAWQTSLEHVSVRLVVRPATRPAGTGAEVVVRGVPVETRKRISAWGSDS